MKIKTAEEVLKKYESRKLAGDKYGRGSIIIAMQEYAKQFIDYASENVEADYNMIYKNDILQDEVEVFICKGEFDKIKELIK